MASRIIEFFGYDAGDTSGPAKQARDARYCPFLKSTCVKTLNDGEVSGACTLQPATSGPVICCPIRLYADNYKILKDVAETVFPGPLALVAGNLARHTPVPAGHAKVAVFGKGWGGELRLPNRGKSGGYFVDWILALLDGNGELVEFVAVEVQSIDTTGNYRKEREDLLSGRVPSKLSTAGFNWENVSKRILPQLIYKGHALRQDSLCKKGLFFVCPTPVYNKIRERLAGKLLSYGLQPGALTLVHYDIGPEVPAGQVRDLLCVGSFTTTVDQVALAFTSPSNLPPVDAYQKVIREAL
ncbi:MAG: NotI family restriction endonuclease [Rhodanobacter sp.]